MEPEYKAYLIVRELGTKKEIHRVGLQNLSDAYVKRVTLGLLLNMNDKYYVDDSEIEAARRVTPRRNGGGR